MQRLLYIQATKVPACSGHASIHKSATQTITNLSPPQAPQSCIEGQIGVIHSGAKECCEACLVQLEGICIEIHDIHNFEAGIDVLRIQVLNRRIVSTTNLFGMEI